MYRIAPLAVARSLFFCIDGILIAISAVSAPVHADTLSFDEALSLALRTSPALRANALQTDAAKLAAIPANALPDPTLALGLDNVPVSGDDRFQLDRDGMTMRRIGVMQAFPNGSKRDARSAAAHGRVALTEATEHAARTMVLRETAAAWIAREGFEKQLAYMEKLLEENRILDATARARVASGQASAMETIMPRREAAMIDERRDELRARRDQAVAALRRWIGTAAQAPLQGSSPEFILDNNTLMGALEQHPDLLLFSAKAGILTAEIAEARAAKIPDWSLEFGYQNRARPFDDMVSLQLRFDLPLIPGSRQEPLIAAKRAEKDALEAEREATLRDHAAQIEADLAEYRRLVNAEIRQREILLPLANEKVALTTSAWRSGKGPLADLISARAERIDNELRQISLHTERLILAARLHYAYVDRSPKEIAP